MAASCALRLGRAGGLSLVVQPLGMAGLGWAGLVAG